MAEVPRRRPSLYESAGQELISRLEAEAAGTDRPEQERYRTDIVAWAQDVLGVAPETLRWSLYGGPYASRGWDGTPDPLAAICENLGAGRDVGAEAGVGTGKTYLLAIIGMWFLDCWEDAQVITVAPKEDQLTLHMWRWVGHFFPRFKRRRPRAELGKLRLRMKPDADDRDAWAMVGFVAGVGADEEVATKASGFHAEHMLIIFEETPGINPAIMMAFEQTCVAPHNVRLAVGNPDHQRDPLHEFCTPSKNPGVVPIRISALDHPNVVLDDPYRITGAVTKPSVEKKLAKWGEAGLLYRSRVRGLSPAQAANALIQLDWCYAARDRGRALAARLWPGAEGARLEDLLNLTDGKVALPPELDGPLAIGVDVANSKAGDEAAVARGRGPICVGVESFPCPNANDLGGQIAVEARALGVDADYIGVDGVGVGAGCVNELLAQGLGIQNLQGGMDESVAGEELFISLRAQMWYQAREDLRFGRVILPDDEELFADLTTPTFQTRGGKIVVEPKEHFRRALGRSPNKGDAFVYWNWVRQMRAGATLGGTAVGF